MSKIDKKNRFYYDSNFLGSSAGRSLRILSEYYGPLQRLDKNNVSETIVFFGSARIKSKKESKTESNKTPTWGDPPAAQSTPDLHLDLLHL